MEKRNSFKPKSFKEIVGKREKGEQWTGNILRNLAEQMILYPTSDEEILKMNITNKFFKELDREISNSEIIKMQINGQVRSSKSTVGIAIGAWILELINKYFPDRAFNQEFSMLNLCRDNQEKIKAMRNPDLMYTVLVTDESNALESGGENATTEASQGDVFSDVQAGRYISNIDICPTGQIDKNADIKLEMRNREKGMSHCYLYYKLQGQWILLGYVDIDVSKLIKNWKKVEPRFFRYLKTREEDDRKYIEYWSKKDFYVEYMSKKYQKMDLMNREGILRPRELDYSGVILEVVQKTKGLVQIMSIQRLKNPIQSYVEMEFKRSKIPASMVGVEMTTRRVMSVLTLMSTMRELKIEIKALLKKYNSGKISEYEYTSQIRIIKEHEENLNNLTEMQINELKRYKKINERYNTHYEENKNE